MSHLTGIYGERVVALLLAAAIAARADIDDGNLLDKSLCDKIGDQLRELLYQGDYYELEYYSAIELRRQLYTEWPEGSRSETYPVPGPEEDRDMIDEVRADCRSSAAGSSPSFTVSGFTSQPSSTRPRHTS